MMFYIMERKKQDKKYPTLEFPVLGVLSKILWTIQKFTWFQLARQRELTANFKYVNYSFKKNILQLWLAWLWIGHHPAHWKASGSISNQGARLGCAPGPLLGAHERQPIDVSLTHWCFSPSVSLPSSLSLSKNK